MLSSLNMLLKILTSSQGQALDSLLRYHQLTFLKCLNIFILWRDGEKCICNLAVRNLVREVDSLATEVDSSIQGYTTTAEASLWLQQRFHSFLLADRRYEQSSQKILLFLISLLSNNHIKSSQIQFFKTSQHKHVQCFIERYAALQTAGLTGYEEAFSKVTSKFFVPQVLPQKANSSPYYSERR